MRPFTHCRGLTLQQVGALVRYCPTCGKFAWSPEDLATGAVWLARNTGAPAPYHHPTCEHVAKVKAKSASGA